MITWGTKVMERLMLDAVMGGVRGGMNYNDIYTKVIACNFLGSGKG